MRRKKLFEVVFQEQGLTPIQQVVLDAFADDELHDRTSIALKLCGHHSNLIDFSSFRKLVGDVIGQLVVLELIEPNSKGAWRLPKHTAG